MQNQPEETTYQPESESDNLVSDAAQPTTRLNEPFSWTASEGAQIKRGGVWYILFSLAVIGLMALAVFVFRSITFAVLLPVMAVAVILLSSRSPREINYAISPKGIYVSDQLHDFSEFRAFGVIQDPEHLSIVVLPVKRFSLGLTLYFEQGDGERIVDMLGARLPMQEVKVDSLEKLIRLIRL